MQADRHGVLVSGASSGIGHETIVLLAQQGYRVYAGVRQEADHERITKLTQGRVTPLFLDVTQPESVLKAVSEISRNMAGLEALSLVNNAGIVVPGPVEFLPVEEWQRQFEVNVFGVVRLTQAMLPLIRQVGKGRVVMVSSIAGRASMPFAGAYSASKFALESLSDSLRLELAPSGIGVVLVEPGVIKTPIWKKSLIKAKSLEESFPPQSEIYYGPAYQTLLEMTRGYDTNGLPPGQVAREIVRAVAVPWSKNRVVIGRDAMVRLLAKLFPSELLDLVILRVLGHHA